MKWGKPVSINQLMMSFNNSPINPHPPQFGSAELQTHRAPRQEKFLSMPNNVLVKWKLAEKSSANETAGTNLQNPFHFQPDGQSSICSILGEEQPPPAPVTANRTVQ